MPLPTPKKNETSVKFISRCMKNENSKKEFPKQNDRLGFCYSQWKKKGKKK